MFIRALNRQASKFMKIDENQAWQASQGSEPKFPSRASEIFISLPTRPLTAKFQIHEQL